MEDELQRAATCRAIGYQKHSIFDLLLYAAFS